jgi:hypothetical protein
VIRGWLLMLALVAVAAVCWLAVVMVAFRFT